MGVIDCIDIRKSFKTGKESVNVLNGVNLNVEKGDFLSIMGASGSGKSTLLYIMGGFDSQDSGKIKINSTDISSFTEEQKSILKRRYIGFVFQFYNLVPNLSVEDNILLPIILDKKKIKRYERRLNDILEVIEMSDKKNVYPRELSGGQQQRVAIARALIFEPDIILADEPIGNLDSKAGMGIMSLFRDINSQYETTIVQVTHSNEAASYGNKIVFMKDGMIINQ